MDELIYSLERPLLIQRHDEADAKNRHSLKQ